MKVFGKAAREGLEEQAKKMKLTSSKKVPKTYSRTKCLNKNTRY